MVRTEMRRTKIVCTIGPSSSSESTITRLISAGMDVARLNFSHGTYEQFAKIIHHLRKNSEITRKPVAILQDLQGPRIRIGEMDGGSATLTSGDHFTLTSRPVVGTAKEASVTYSSLPGEVRPGDVLLLADGALELEVVKSNQTDITCRVIVGGSLGSHKGVNLPTGTLRVPALTLKDMDDLKFGLSQAVDFVSLSFVRSAIDIENLRRLMKEQGRVVPIIAKIEKHEALDCIDGIVEAADGLMVARGDLGVEVPIERVPLIQKSLIHKANATGKPVITATQMLRSMVSSPRPTRAEATDVANAILDGTDALMLSEETAIGQYPLEAVRMMSRIAIETEREHSLIHRPSPAEVLSSCGTSEAISHAASSAAADVCAAVIVTPTRTGNTARLVARRRPSQPIVAMSPNPETVRRLCLTWGVLPVHMDKAWAAEEEAIACARRVVLDLGLARKGDTIVITAGFPTGAPGITNTLRLEKLTP